MRLGKKIIGIVMSAFTLLLATLFLIFSISTTIRIINNSDGPYQIMFVEVFRLIAALALTIICAVTGGINLKKAIRGVPEAMLNRLVLFIAFDCIGVGAVVGYLIGFGDFMKAEFIASLIAYTIAIFTFITAITIVSTLARRRALTQGRKLSAGIMLAIISTLMVTVLIIKGAAAQEIIFARYYVLPNNSSQEIRDFYSAFEIIAALVGICGTTAFAALTIVEAILEKRRGVQPAKVEEKPAE